ncbi:MULTISPECIES: NDP-hexose 2,3-dehydratase family protein [unclassified Streptomyces]|uniref:NDP-hexose 2,3-dehydratase family protein n=1 Tax=unclassified Streptomyces TaxID=2593676 RepID=UPI002DDC81AD|nr:NDP-hexose 2,3-dehydratase family protein [Streptomyces sp. NBC_01237]WRZ75222.1 NDP-hexose 2,3-dehydratase family protein [Streptomyces sp. NBC_01237]
MFGRMSEFHAWFAERQRAQTCRVTPAPLDALDGWEADRGASLIRHRTGRFFTVEGLEVSTGNGEGTSWAQPIINQPESGILGILVKRFGGVPHYLLQAKMEPGNINVLQLSPTVQATHSNYTGVHRGTAVPYLEYFLAPRRGKVLFDALQSEQGAWFLRKRNRNMIIEVAEDVPLLDRFCWLTREQIGELLRCENLVNMDTRTVLSGLPLPVNPDEPGAHSTAEILSWFTEAKAGRRLERSRVPLDSIKDWVREEGRIVHTSGRYFSVMGVDVEAGDREVARWSQPMIAPVGRGLIAFLTRTIQGVPHLLIQACTEAGTRDVVEVGPTVQCNPGNFAQEPAASWPRFLGSVLSAPPSRIRLDVVHSEEGGRFYHAENRYAVVEAGDDFPDTVPDGFIWATVGQLTELARLGNVVNVEARNLLASLRLIP